MVLYPLEGKTILITGASLGIGRATAHAFARQKCRLILTYFKDEKEGMTARKECLEKGAKSVDLLPLDTGSEKSIRRFVRDVLKKRKKIDVLVNNAGIFIHQPLLAHTTADIGEEVGVNLLGPIRITHALLAHVNECVVNVASEAGRNAYPRMPVYCATKFGVRGFTKGMAIDYPHIRWYVVNPDYTATRMTHFKGMNPSEVARVIRDVVKGTILMKNGGDVNVKQWARYPTLKKEKRAPVRNGK